MSKLSMKAGCGLGFRGKIWYTYPERFYISLPLDSAWHHSGRAYFLSIRIKISLSSMRASWKFKKKRNPRIWDVCLQGLFVLHLKNTEDNLCSVQLISIHCLNWDSFHFWEMRTISYLVLFKWSWEVQTANQKRFYFYEYSVFMQIWFHETTRMTEYIEKIAYQYVIKCNICTLDEICMTNWVAGRSSEPLHKSSLKFLSLWLWHYTETENERDRQRKMNITISYRDRKSLASYTENMTAKNYVISLLK